MLLLYLLIYISVWQSERSTGLSPGKRGQREDKASKRAA